jgi:g-D-glutamyl-meso-diaminopimelate peptidase
VACVGIIAKSLHERESERTVLEENSDAETAYIIEPSGQDTEEEDTLINLKQESDLIIMNDPEQYTYEDLQTDAAVLEEVYPGLIVVDSLGQTLDGRELYHFVIGEEEAPKKIFINGGIHAREYMTSQLVMKQTVSFLHHMKNGDTYKEQSYDSLLKDCCIHVAAMVNPDGISISQSGMAGIRTEQVKTKVEGIAQLDGQSLEHAYLTGWKANANGVDLNRNFDALWEEYADPAGHPSSDHYKGTAPGSEPESRALIELTQKEQFIRTISYHTQGNVIYWYFAQEGDLYQKTESFGKRISQLTGYPMDADYEKLDPAGYKDWAISKQAIPSLTIEVGSETSPVPSWQFSGIWDCNEFVWEETLLDVLEG